MVENVLVSGGSGGIGAAVCRRLGQQGFRPVIGFSSNRESATTLAAETGGVAVELDLTDSIAIEAAVTLLENDGNDLAGVVLAASPAPAIGPVFRLPENEMEDQWAVNVKGPHMLLEGVVKRLMRPRKQGWVVGILSLAMGVHGEAAKNMGGYIVSKYGLMGLLKVIDAEFSWLDVHTLKPGYTDTPMLDVFDERFLDQMRDSLPQKRFATTKEIADMVMAKIGGA